MATLRLILAAGISALFILYAGGCVFSSRTPVNKRIRISQFTYGPEKINIKAGDSITWVNKDTFGHTVSADDGKYDSGMIGKDGKVEVQFDEPGTFTYFCSPHPFMKGTVVVK